LNTLHLCRSKAWGGREIYSCTVISELKKAGCGVHAVCMSGSRIEGFLKDRGISCIHLAGDSRLNPASIIRIRSLIHEKRINAVHAHLSREIWPASLAIKGDCGARLFFTNYSGGRSKKDIFHRIVYSRLDGVFTSSALTERLAGMYPIDPSKIHLLPYGRRIEEYRPDKKKRAEIRKQHGIGDNEILIGTLVRIDPTKGPLDLVAYLPYIDKKFREQIRIMIVGEPTRRSKPRFGQTEFDRESEAYSKELSGFIEKNGLQDKVILPGFQDDLTGYLGAMDIFVFPSRHELYALAVLDAMCMRLPVIATRVGGNLEQICENKTGLFYEAGDSRDLARKISLYLADPELRKAHGEKARRFVMEKHDMDKMITTLIKHYKNQA